MPTAWTPTSFRVPVSAHIGSNDKTFRLSSRLALSTPRPAVPDARRVTPSTTSRLPLSKTVSRRPPPPRCRCTRRLPSLPPPSPRLPRYPPSLPPRSIHPHPVPPPTPPL